MTVRYAVPENTDDESVTMRLYDVLGQEVRTVVRSEEDGRHEWRTDLSGLPSGTYFLWLRAFGVTKTQRLTVIR